MKVSDALSIQKQAKKTFEGRKVGILFAEGSDKASIDKLKADIEAAGGTVKLVAPKVGGIPVKGGELKADEKLDGAPSVVFDAIASVLMPDAAEKLTKNAAAIQWFADAFAHCKTIGHCKGSQILLDKANVEKDEGVVPWEELVKVGPVRHWAREPKVRDLA
jgi:catalase